MLTFGKIFGGGDLTVYLWCMTFKQLANDLMAQGWRCYHILDVPNLSRGSNLQSLAIRSLIEVRVYEGKSLVFVKDCKPPEDGTPTV